MKPVFQEDKIAKFKAIMAEVNGDGLQTDLTETLSDLELEIKNLPDIRESKALLILLSICIFGLSAALIYKGYYWPSLVAVAWFGALLYYRVNERSLSIDALNEKAKITPFEHSTKINYLLSGIHQKQNRLKLIRTFNFAFWPFVIFMGQLFINEENPIWILWTILLVIAVINTFFWISFYKPQLSALEELETQFIQLNASLLLGKGNSQKGLKLFEEEE